MEGEILLRNLGYGVKQSNKRSTSNTDFDDQGWRSDFGPTSGLPFFLGGGVERW